MNVLSRKGLAAALVVSLAFNFCIGGIFLSKWLFKKEISSHRKGYLKRFERAAEQLDEQAKKRVTEIQEQQGPLIKSGIVAVRQSRKKVNQQLIAETLDLPSLEQAMKELDTHSRTVKSRIHTLMKEVAITLSTEERIKYFESLRRRRSKRRQSQHRSKPNQ